MQNDDELLDAFGDEMIANLEELDHDEILADMRNNPVPLDAFWHQMNMMRLKPYITGDDMTDLMRARSECPQTEWTFADDVYFCLDKMVDVEHVMQLYTHHKEEMDNMVEPLTFAECVNRWRQSKQ